MNKVILFGGTTEGRKLAWYCACHQIPATVCVVSDYGADLVPESPWISVRTGAMEEQEMEELFCRERPSLVLDSTHPYAFLVTENIKKACEHQKVDYVRVAREKSEEGLESTQETVWVESAEEAAGFLSGREGRILVTTGKKDLECFSKIPGFGERVFARVLPDESSIALCRRLGLKGSQIIAMQGPFSFEMNLAIMNMTKASYLVTKESGAVGGFAEKAEAARAAGAVAIVIGRPKEIKGISLNEAVQRLRPYGNPGRQTVYLVGIGMGGPGQMTGEAADCIRRCQGIAGSGRMMESVSGLCREKEKFVSYKPEEILCWLNENPQMEQAAVVYSGDTGFYSGARVLAKLLEKEPEKFRTVMVPGISTVSYFCARLGIGWEDLFLGSLHGRQADLENAAKTYKKIFLLMGGAGSVKELCGHLAGPGWENWLITVGVSLSYPEERIVKGTAKELEGQEFEGLCAVLLEHMDKETGSEESHP